MLAQVAIALLTVVQSPFFSSSALLWLPAGAGQVPSISGSEALRMISHGEGPARSVVATRPAQRRPSGSGPPFAHPEAVVVGGLVEGEEVVVGIAPAQVRSRLAGSGSISSDRASMAAWWCVGGRRAADRCSWPRRSRRAQRFVAVEPHGRDRTTSPSSVSASMPPNGAGRHRRPRATSVMISTAVGGPRAGRLVTGAGLTSALPRRPPIRVAAS